MPPGWKEADLWTCLRRSVHLSIRDPVVSPVFEITFQAQEGLFEYMPTQESKADGDGAGKSSVGDSGCPSAMSESGGK